MSMLPWVTGAATTGSARALGSPRPGAEASVVRCSHHHSPAISNTSAIATATHALLRTYQARAGGCCDAGSEGDSGTAMAAGVVCSSVLILLASFAASCKHLLRLATRQTVLSYDIAFKRRPCRTRAYLPMQKRLKI